MVGRAPLSGENFRVSTWDRPGPGHRAPRVARSQGRGCPASPRRPRPPCRARREGLRAALDVRSLLRGRAVEVVGRRVDGADGPVAPRPPAVRARVGSSIRRARAGKLSLRRLLDAHGPLAPVCERGGLPRVVVARPVGTACGRRARRLHPRRRGLQVRRLRVRLLCAQDAGEGRGGVTQVRRVVRRVEAEGGDEATQQGLEDVDELRHGQVGEDKCPDHRIEDGGGVVRARALRREGEARRRAAHGRDGELEAPEANVSRVRGQHDARRLLQQGEPDLARRGEEVEVEPVDNRVCVGVQVEEPVHGRAALARGGEGVGHAVGAGGARTQPHRPEEPDEQAQGPEERQYHGAQHHAAHVVARHHPERVAEAEIRRTARRGPGSAAAAAGGRGHARLLLGVGARARPRRPGPVSAEVPDGGDPGGDGALRVLHHEDQGDARDGVRRQQPDHSGIKSGQRVAAVRDLQQA
mmetsp:Transcript_25986/g.76158  ORF Transcript_25986/g.76158 Transcript_25986/m.76158 type:complete len:468 (-) Transcript_25986:1176-2579(-)